MKCADKMERNFVDERTYVVAIMNKNWSLQTKLVIVYFESLVFSYLYM